jgi:hypothetical protein
MVVRLIHYLDEAGVRKLESDLTSGSETVQAAAQFVANRFGYAFNTFVLKRYTRGEDYVSGAYEPHQDPADLRSVPLCLFTLSGSADFTYWDDQKVENHFSFGENMAVLLRPDLTHQVSEPTNESGIRYLLFLGYREETEG